MPLDYGTEAALTANNALPQTVFFDASSTSNNSITFDVNKEPYYVESFNLAGGDTITVQQVAGDGAGTVFQNFAPLGTNLHRTSALSKLRIDWPGRYRLVFAGTSVAAVYCVGHAGTMTHNTIYKTAAGQGGGGGGGFTLTPSNTPSVNLTYSGNTSTGSLSANANISADAGNAVSIHADGLFAASGGGSFSMPFTAETSSFTVGNTYSSYSSDSSETTPTATLPSTTSAQGQFYFINSKGTSGTVIDPVTAPINNAAGIITVPTGMTCVLYSSPDDTDGWLLNNYTQISPNVGNIIYWDGAGVYAGYTPPVYSSTYYMNPGGAAVVNITDQIFISVIGSSSATASTVYLPALPTHIVQIAILNVAGGATSQTIHPATGAPLNGSASNVTLAPGKSIIITNASGSEPAGWWTIGGIV